MVLPRRACPKSWMAAAARVRAAKLYSLEKRNYNIIVGNMNTKDSC